MLRRILRIEGRNISENGLKKKILRWVAEGLAEDEIAILDAEGKVYQFQAAGIQRFVLRLASNCTGRRNFLPKRNKRGRPQEKGDIVRPLARTRQGNSIAASKPDLRLSFTWQGRKIQVHGWQGLVSSDLKPDPGHDTFDIWVFFDPA